MNQEKINSATEQNNKPYIDFNISDPDLLTNTYNLEESPEEDPNHYGTSGGDAEKFEKENNVSPSIDKSENLPVISQEQELMVIEEPLILEKNKVLTEDELADEDWIEIEKLSDIRNISLNDAKKFYLNTKK
ncbi:MAG TPA: hypothetical protein PLO25_01300 [Candidatus Saccharibacteria bacterium]|nr:hypothetical protein [Candidatus Saccharibacteria bacterium]